MTRTRSRAEQCAAALATRIQTETVLCPLDILPYTNYEGVRNGALPIETPSGLTPEYCIYAVAPSGYRVYIYNEYGLDQLKSDQPELVR